MKLTFKTLQQEQFHLEVEPEATILSVKQKINEERGFGEATQKLIYSGKILADDKTVSSYGISENGFIVVMVTKPPSAAASTSKAPAASASTTAKAETKVPASASTPSTSTPAASATTTETSSTEQAESKLSSSSASEALVTGEHFEQAVQNMMEMGFPRDQVMQAMRASFNNPDRAVEYLMTGIPEGLEGPPSSAPNMTASVEGEEDGNNIAFLQSNPHFQRLRQAVHRNPELLQPLLQQLAQANPRLMEVIEQNQEEFMQMMLGGSDEDFPAEGEGGDYVEGAEGETGLPNVRYINVTAEEKEAIDRLVAMGFDRALAIEAYLACDKNEELAANFLFDNMHD
ncbi:XPC-binding domain-containing protein [Syncephalis fuscata]|nr:XPC-binding domain-containing protein [Syncephalis fuscata]